MLEIQYKVLNFNQRGPIFRVNVLKSVWHKRPKWFKQIPFGNPVEPLLKTITAVSLTFSHVSGTKSASSADGCKNDSNDECFSEPSNTTICASISLHFSASSILCAASEMVKTIFGVTCFTNDLTSFSEVFASIVEIMQHKNWLATQTIISLI